MKKSGLFKTINVAPLIHRLCVVTSEQEMLDALNELGIPDSGEWNRDSLATTHTFTCDHHLAFVIAFRRTDVDECIEYACHEAVHVWWAYANHYGMKNCDEEHVAYGVQFIFANIVDQLRSKNTAQPHVG